MQKLEKEVQLLLNLFKLKKLSEAELLNRKLIKENSRSVFLYNILGLILYDQKKIDDAIKHYEEGIKIDPKYAAIYDNLGTAYKSKGEYEKAESYYLKSINLDENKPEPLNNLGNLYIVLNKSQKAIDSYKKAIKINSNFFSSYYNLGVVYKNVGEFNEAKKNLNEAIKLNDLFYRAHRSMSELIKYSKNENHYNILIKLYKDNKIDKSKKTELIFALAKASEDLNKYKEAYSYYKEANNYRRKEIFFSFKDEKNEFDIIKKVFNQNLFQKYQGLGNEDSSTIFILGMPRSGTTLIEQVLSSHKSVFGGDELNFLPHLIEKIFFNDDKKFISTNYNFDSIDFKKIGAEYVRNLKKISNDSNKITDKLPINFKWIGLIKLILPNSKIIHCRRNAKDTCLSIFKNYFVNPKLNFAYDLKELSSYYKLYYDLMNHWNQVLPGFIIDCHYENMVNNPKDEIRRLINKCNLNWDENCLKYHNNKRMIKTASDTQARKKIYKTSVNSWKKYGKDLNELFSKLPK